MEKRGGGGRCSTKFRWYFQIVHRVGFVLPFSIHEEGGGGYRGNCGPLLEKDACLVIVV